MINFEKLCIYRGASCQGLCIWSPAVFVVSDVGSSRFFLGWVSDAAAQRQGDDALQDEKLPEELISALASWAAGAEPDGPPCKTLGHLLKLEETFLCGLPEKRQVEVRIEDMEVAGLIAEVVHLDPYPTLRALQEVFCSGYEKTEADGGEAARCVLRLLSHVKIKEIPSTSMVRAAQGLRLVAEALRRARDSKAGADLTRKAATAREAREDREAKELRQLGQGAQAARPGSSVEWERRKEGEKERRRQCKRN